MADMEQKSVQVIRGCKLLLTCSCCPEQYDVFKGDIQIGYLRLRHGQFRADYPDCGEQTVYETESCKGDGYFEDDEREKFLRLAVAALISKHRKEVNSK